MMMMSTHKPQIDAACGERSKIHTGASSCETKAQFEPAASAEQGTSKLSREPPSRAAVNVDYLQAGPIHNLHPASVTDSSSLQLGDEFHPRHDPVHRPLPNPLRHSITNKFFDRNVSSQNRCASIEVEDGHDRSKIANQERRYNSPVIRRSDFRPSCPPWRRKRRLEPVNWVENNDDAGNGYYDELKYRKTTITSPIFGPKTHPTASRPKCGMADVDSQSEIPPPFPLQGVITQDGKRTQHSGCRHPAEPSSLPDTRVERDHDQRSTPGSTQEKFPEPSLPLETGTKPRLLTQKVIHIKDLSPENVSTLQTNCKEWQFVTWLDDLRRVFLANRRLYRRQRNRVSKALDRMSEECRYVWCLNFTRHSDIEDDWGIFVAWSRRCFVCEDPSPANTAAIRAILGRLDRALKKE